MSTAESKGVHSGGLTQRVYSTVVVKDLIDWETNRYEGVNKHNFKSNGTNGMAK